jgi:hypothetical protein
MTDRVELKVAAHDWQESVLFIRLVALRVYCRWMDKVTSESILYLIK